MEERKSMGGALVDVFDAGVILVKSEINGVARKVGDTAKAKGVGVVLLLAAVGPLIMALVFLILAVFYGLIRLGAGPWFAALLIALFSLVVTGALIFIGLKRLGAEVKSDEPLVRRNTMSDDDQKYTSARAGTTPAATGMNPGKAPAASSGEDWKISPDAPRPSVAGSRPNDSIEVPRDPQKQAAGENRVVAERAGNASSPGSATVRVEKGTTTVPVYESKPSGEASNYGSGLNEKLDEQDEQPRDPNLQEPVALRGAPGIPVSTEPTFRTDMQKGKN